MKARAVKRKKRVMKTNSNETNSNVNLEKEKINLLAIESSCDETAASVIENGRIIKSNIISSQISIHTKFGGVVPEIASRKHIENIGYVVDSALEEANMTKEEIDGICVTYGPGLVGALLVGVGYAKAMAYALDKPLVGVNHIKGHIAANYLTHKELEPPFLCLVVSGGHSNIVIVKDYTDFEIVARTRDDAPGEAFDKVARVIGLGYPGGQKIDALSKQGNKEAIPFPRASVEGSKYDFSFSGLKSAVLNYLNGCKMKNETYVREDVAASFQEAVVDVLVTHTMEAAADYGIDKIAMAGGVAANTALRGRMELMCNKRGYKLYYPEPILCTDNAAMIGSAGYYDFISGKRADWSLNAIPGLELA